MAISVQFTVNLLFYAIDTASIINKLKTLIAMGRFLFQGLLRNVEIEINSE